jgi:hypothetical protein
MVCIMERPNIFFFVFVDGTVICGDYVILVNDESASCLVGCGVPVNSAWLQQDAAGCYSNISHSYLPTSMPSPSPDLMPCWWFHAGAHADKSAHGSGTENCHPIRDLTKVLNSYRLCFSKVSRPGHGTCFSARKRFT